MLRVVLAGLAVLALSFLLARRLTEGLRPAAAAAGAAAWELPVQLLDADGRPAAGVPVVLTARPPDPAGRAPALARAVTGPDGRARLTVPPGRARRLRSGPGVRAFLVARFPARTAPWRAIDPAAPAPEEGWILRLPPAGILALVLTGPDGEPLPDPPPARLYLRWRASSSSPPSPELVRSVPDGRCEIPCGPGLRFDLEVARADGRRRSRLAAADGPAAPGERVEAARPLPVRFD
ncbi:MAG: hypothetical protein D6702_03930 [Planctomycetota bacterium]|nr:MAG: hypothetical protein D6702_03930 [Planctomycetota bacterium]